jgi:hypothetical protein
MRSEGKVGLRCEGKGKNKNISSPLIPSYSSWVLGRFIEMCIGESTLAALQYLQTEISSIVDHEDEEESAAFRGLLSLLLSRPPTPTATARATNGADSKEPAGSSDRRSLDRDLEMTEGSTSNGKRPKIDESASSTGPRNLDLQYVLQRQETLDAVLAFIHPMAKMPKANITDLARAG